MLKEILAKHFYNLKIYPEVVLLNGSQRLTDFEETIYKTYKGKFAKIVPKKKGIDLFSFPYDLHVFHHSHLAALSSIYHAKLIIDCKLTDAQIKNNNGVIVCIPGDEIFNENYIENLVVDNVVQKYDLLIAQSEEQFFQLNKIIKNRSKVIQCSNLKKNASDGQKRFIKICRIATSSLEKNTINFLHRINTPERDIFKYYIIHRKYHSLFGLIRRHLLFTKLKQNYSSKVRPFIIECLKFVFGFFPLARKVVLFRTFQQSYTCNPKYICEEILSRDLDIKVVWIANHKKVNITDFPKNVIVAQQNSFLAWYYLSCSHILIDNNVRRIENMPKKKAGQVYIQTWHGSLGIKKFESVWSEQNQKYSDCTTDLLLSNSKFETGVYRSSVWPTAQILECGHPRNDLFFADQNTKLKIKKKVFAALDINEGCSVILYAPTFRDQHLYGTSKQKKDLSMLLTDFERVIEACNQKFKRKFVLVVRMHNHMIQAGDTNLEGLVFNGSSYPDIQELMIASDISITDYSSWIYDFILLRRPGFIYATDCDKYLKQRELYFPIQTTPFPFSSNTEELIENIQRFDYEKFDNEVEKFLLKAECIDDGKASVKVCDYIEKILQ